MPCNSTGGRAAAAAGAPGGAASASGLRDQSVPLNGTGNVVTYNLHSAAYENEYDAVGAALASVYNGTVDTQQVDSFLEGMGSLNDINGLIDAYTVQMNNYVTSGLGNSPGFNAVYNLRRATMAARALFIKAGMT